MANNKFRDNHGVGAADQRQIDRVARRGPPSEPDPHTKQVPRSATKPGRKYAGEGQSGTPETLAEEDVPTESNNARGNVTHHNR
jgi:hypothetical protein